MQQPKGPLPPPRGVPKSVSDLYCTDEIDFLLDEIKDLEPACCQLEDIQVDLLVDQAPLKPPRTRLQQQQPYSHDQQRQPQPLQHNTPTITTTNSQPTPESTPPPPTAQSTASVGRLTTTITTTTSTLKTHSEKFCYTPSPQRGAHHQHQSHIEDNTDDNFILIIPSPKLSAKHNSSARDAQGRKSGFLRRVFRRKTIEQQEQHQQRIHFLQTDKELHEIELCDAKGKRHKRSKKNLVVLAGRVDTEDDEDIVPISIGENDDLTDDQWEGEKKNPLDENGEESGGRGTATGGDEGVACKKTAERKVSVCHQRHSDHLISKQSS